MSVNDLARKKISSLLLTLGVAGFLIGSMLYNDPNRSLMLTLLTMSSLLLAGGSYLAGYARAKNMRSWIKLDFSKRRK